MVKSGLSTCSSVWPTSLSLISSLALTLIFCMVLGSKVSLRSGAALVPSELEAKRMILCFGAEFTVSYRVRASLSASLALLRYTSSLASFLLGKLPMSTRFCSVRMTYLSRSFLSARDRVPARASSERASLRSSR